MTAVYDRIGQTYADQRTTDPRIAAAIDDALGDAQSVLNVGAGTGSYEPHDRWVIAAEPSRVMIAQRGIQRAPAVRAVAEQLPLADKSFDAVLAVLTLHHWTDQQRGLAECARVARDVIVLLTWDPASTDFWLVRDYFPSLMQQDRLRFPTIAEIGATLGDVEVRPLLIPADCVDGFLGAFWRRPDAYLDETIRGGISSFANCSNLDVGLSRLRTDINSGAWHARNNELMQLNAIDLGYRLLIARM